MANPTSIEGVLSDHNVRLRKLETRSIPIAPEVDIPDIPALVTTEWDCIVDSTLTTSLTLDDVTDTDIPQYMGISEALNDFAAHSLPRCWALIRSDGSGSTTYDERTVTLSLTGLANVRLFGQTTDSNDDTNQAIIWEPKNSLTISGTGSRFTLENLMVQWVGSAGGGLTVDVGVLLGSTLLWEGGGSSVTQSVTCGYLYARHCTFGSTSGSTSAITFSATKATYIGCEAYISANDGHMTFTTTGHGYADIVHGTSNITANTYIEFAGTGSWEAHTRFTTDFRGISIGGTPRGDLQLTGTGTTSIFPQTSGSLTLGNTGRYIAHGSVNDLVVSAACEIDFTGAIERFINCTVSTAKGTIHAVCKMHAIFRGGPWLVDLDRQGPTNGGNPYFLNLAASVVRSTFRIAGNSSGTAGEQPYTIAAGCNNNLIIFPGAASYPTGGTDSGTNNRILTELTDTLIGAPYTDEMAQDAVGTILTDSATIDFTYSDPTPSITADVKTGSITVAMLAFDPATQAELDAAMLRERIRRILLVP